MMATAYQAAEKRPETNMVRVQIDLPSATVEELDRLANEAGLATRKELMSNALTLLKWAVKHVRNGRTIASVDDRENRMIELDMPFLSALAGSNGAKDS